jgi:hypothetical protein
MKNKDILFKRLSAYIIDATIIYIIINLLIEIPFLTPNEKKYNQINDKLETIILDYENDKITLNEFKNEYIEINYEVIKIENKINICRVILIFIYFVIIPWKFKGQTIGKKIFKIKIVSTANGNLSFTSYFFRAILINNLFLYIMIIFGRYCLNDVSNYYLMFTTSLIRNIIMYSSAVTILFRKNSRGIHDLIVGSKVISEC